MQAEPKLARSREMLCEEALIESNGIQYTIRQLETLFVVVATHNTSYELPLRCSYLLAPCPDIAFRVEMKNARMTFVKQVVK